MSKSIQDCYTTLRALRGGNVVQIEGVAFVEDKSGDQKEFLLPGDSYVAERNTGPHLLTVKYVNWDTGVVFPVENAYPFDVWECVKVKLYEK